MKVTLTIVFILFMCGSFMSCSSANAPGNESKPFPSNITSNGNLVSNSSTADNTRSNSAPSRSPVVLYPSGANGIKPGPAQEAPDNSQVTTVLADNLVQTRYFRNHPRLEKVEETTLISEGNRKVIKVFLKNKQVKEIPEGKIADPMKESTANILNAVEQ